MTWSEDTIIALLNQIRDNPAGKSGTVPISNFGGGSWVDQEIIGLLTQILYGKDVLNNWDRLINLWGQHP
jgi:hypothetical protein